MEEHTVVARLDQSRAQLRAMLLPDPLTGEIEADVFPRSSAMRFLFDSGKRRMAISALSTVAMLAGRGGMAKASLVATLVQTVRQFIGARRR